MSYNDLSSDLMEKAKARRTPEDVMALAEEEGYELSKKELEGLGGGVSASGDDAKAFDFYKGLEATCRLG